MYIKKLCKKYGENVILNVENTNFKNDAVHGVIGKNGAGKTTLLRCLSNTLKPTIYEGDKVLGTYMAEYTFVSQYLTGIEYLEYVSFFYEKLNTEAILQQYHDEIALLEFSDFIKKKIVTYSYGTSKKLQILAVLLTQREYLFLDEPFNGLDEDVVKNIWQYLNRIKQNHTIFVSTHNYYSFKKEFDVLWQLSDHTLTKMLKGAKVASCAI